MLDDVVFYVFLFLLSFWCADVAVVYSFVSVDAVYVFLFLFNLMLLVWADFLFIFLKYYTSDSFVFSDISVFSVLLEVKCVCGLRFLYVADITDFSVHIFLLPLVLSGFILNFLYDSYDVVFDFFDMFYKVFPGGYRFVCALKSVDAIFISLFFAICIGYFFSALSWTLLFSLFFMCLPWCCKVAVAFVVMVSS